MTALDNPPQAASGGTLDHRGRAASVFARPLATRAQLFLIVVCSASLHAALAATSRTPWLMPDESVYAAVSRAFAHGAIPRDNWSFGPLYCAIVAPLQALLSPTKAYVGVQLLNSCAFSVAAVPAYRLARRVLSHREALVVAALSVALPSGVYTARLMTESFAYPLALLGFVAIVRAVERPTAARQAMVVLSSILAATVRLELLALVLVYAIARALFAVTVARPSGTRAGARIFIIGIVFFLGGVLSLKYAVPHGIAVSHSFAFGRIGGAHAIRVFVAHLGLLDLYVGIGPFAACAALTAAALRGSLSRAELLSTWLTASAVIVLAAVSTLYLIALPQLPGKPHTHIFDRYTFYCAPLLVICLMLALRKGSLVKGRRLLPVLIAATLPAAIPLGRVLTGSEWGSSASAIGLLPFAIIHMLGGGLAAWSALGAVCAGAAGCYLLRPHRGVAVTAIVFVCLAAASSLASASASRVVAGHITQRAWIDAALPPGATAVAVVNTNKAAYDAGVMTVWNARLTGVDDVRFRHTHGGSTGYAAVRGRSCSGQPFVVGPNGRWMLYPMRACETLLLRTTSQW